MRMFAEVLLLADKKDLAEKASAALNRILAAIGSDKTDKDLVIEQPNNNVENKNNFS